MWRYCGIVLVLSFAATTNRQLPGPPRNVRITKCGERRARLQWNHPKKPGHLLMIYRIQYSTSVNPAEWYDAQTVGGTQTKASIQLPGNADVRLRVSAHNAVGWSLPGMTESTCSVPPVRPDRNPKDPVGRGTSERNMVISWESMPPVDHNGPGFKYVVKWRRHSNHEKWQSAEVQYPLNSYIVSGLKTYTKYDIIVQAYNAIGPAVIVPDKYIGFSGEGVPLENPTKFRLEPNVNEDAVDYKLVRFFWLSVAESPATILGEFKGYRIMLEDLDNKKLRQVDILMSRNREFTSNPSAVAAVARDLIPNTSYKAYVSVLNNRHSGPPSNNIFFKTAEGVPGPVERLDALQMSNTSLKLVWRPPKTKNSVVTGYQYVYRIFEGKMSLGPRITGPVLPASTYRTTLIRLQSGSAYRIYVYALSDGGRGDPAVKEVTLKVLKPAKRKYTQPKPSTPNPKLTILETNVNNSLGGICAA
ncbi:neuroglian-like isoform X2 [Lineus longissimus]|uniref:neuroglian-like isoform X2 n=1 Tax=Lineus longissimus TaxID=88925 RepID=UPI00315D8486